MTQDPATVRKFESQWDIELESSEVPLSPVTPSGWGWLKC